MGFYEEIADDYDDVVNNAARAESAARFVAWLAARRPINSAVDAATGTGLYARALAAAGATVLAADISQAMIDQAQRDPAEGVEWLPAPMQSLADRAGAPADAVLCMGNSLPHLLQDVDLGATLAGFRRMLAPGGAAAIQLLNYDRLLAQRERIVGITRSADVEYVRFNDFLPRLVQFNLLEIRQAEGAITHTLHSTQLRPYTASELTPILRECGFGSVECFDGATFEAFDAAESDTLLLIAGA